MKSPLQDHVSLALPQLVQLKCRLHLVHLAMISEKAHHRTMHQQIRLEPGGLCKATIL